MTAIPSQNEDARLRTLHEYQILDTPPEIAFERLTHLTTQIFDVPIALISLVDADRQWFKSCFGMDVRQTDRQLSFCAYAILSDEVMVVPDAAADPRFCDNALVTGPPHIRFYAGAPLKTSEGHNLGSLCVIDTKPREFSAKQQAMLADLAATVVDAMTLRRTARAFRESEATLTETLGENRSLIVALDHISTGVIISDTQVPYLPIIFTNPGFEKLTGYSSQEVQGRNGSFLYGADTNPDDLYELRQAIRDGRPATAILLNYRKDGTSFLSEFSANPVFDSEGKLVNYVVLQNDVTLREQAKQMLERMVQERTAELAHSKMEILNRLARAGELRDDDTGQHTQRVARTAALLAQGLGWTNEQVEMMRMAAPLHDIGKIGISDSILLKPGKLTDEEFDIMKTHTTAGARLLADGHSETVIMAERIAASHHERFDGRGYPLQLAGEEIPIEGRILAVADVFDALTHERPYKKAWPVVEAVAEIQRQSGQQFDPKVVDVFLMLPHEELI
ncbi:MAG: HD domain-containing protein [Proteobacteria bacterium]|nr:MAG: HD domain-containing protein [Pseudomonadota bacterium]